jgi:hypothetical protein
MRWFLVEDFVEIAGSIQRVGVGGSHGDLIVSVPIL